MSVTRPLTSEVDNGAVRALLERELAPQIRAIDEESVYPNELLTKLGALGCYNTRTADGLSHDLFPVIESMAAAAESCLSTAFCMWCQSAFAWYLTHAESRSLREDLGTKVASGAVLGGTALSNPMKHFFGIEPLRLHGHQDAGGYRISGSLPWVSNLGVGHSFALVFEREGTHARRIMAVASCDNEHLILGEENHFLALNGTGTRSLHFKNALISDDEILADPAEPFIKKIRAGFILLQCGMALGIIRNAADSMRALRVSHGEINRYLDLQPEDLEARWAELEASTRKLAKTPHEEDPDYFLSVLQTRLALSELSLEAASSLMLHEGAKGYLRHGHAQRRLREAYFVAIVTPAIKQLKKMLTDLGA